MSYFALFSVPNDNSLKLEALFYFFSNFIPDLKIQTK